jgi:2-methylisocitrate lyase-like PEP mutase family enzyme
MAAGDTTVGSTPTSSLVVSAFAPKPVNFLLIGPKMRVAELADAGVRRVSVGSF